MEHVSPLIVILVAGLGLALVLGTVANRLRLSPIVGYLLAGVAVGPFTPGYVADPKLTLELADLGVILLMFGVGLHFSVADLLSVRAIVIPGAVLQMAISAALATLLAHSFGWPLPSGIVFGAAVSVASTVVLTRALQERHLVDSERGRIAVGWLIVQDVLTVLVLVLLPALAPLLHPISATLAAIDVGRLAGDIGITLAKLAGFFLLIWIVGRRAIPAVLHYVAHTGSRELFRLAVLSLALGVALAAAELFGVSIALGAFLAGMTLSGSPLSRRAAEESLPLRDAFAVLFFVSVGMLFDPRVIASAPLHLAGTILLVLIGTAGAAFLLLRGLGVRSANAAFVAAGLAQVGEFSFVLVNLDISLDLVPREARDLILGTAILSICINPGILELSERLRRRLEPAKNVQPSEALVPTQLAAHAIIVGYGRVGRLLVDGLQRAALPFLVVEEAQHAIEQLRAEGIEVLPGNAADPRVLAAANFPAARMLLLAIPEAFEGGQIVQQARRANPDMLVVARAHFDAEVEHLLQLGANTVIMGEREIAHSMLEQVRSHFLASGSHAPETDTADSLRT